MILRNISKNILIADSVHYADSWLARLIGLMFHLPLNINEGFVIPKCKSIHTFFVKQTLKILVLDINKKLIDKFEIKPSKISKIYREAYYFIELSEKNTNFDRVELGNQISWSHRPLTSPPRSVPSVKGKL